MVHQWRRCHSSLSFFERELTLFGRMLRTQLSKHKIFRVGEDIFSETKGGIWAVCPLKEREVMMVAGRTRMRREWLRSQYKRQCWDEMKDQHSGGAAASGIYCSPAAHPKSGLTWVFILPHLGQKTSRSSVDISLGQIYKFIRYIFHFHIITGSWNCRQLGTQLDQNVQDGSPAWLAVDAGSWLGAWVNTCHLELLTSWGQVQEGISQGPAF